MWSSCDSNLRGSPRSAVRRAITVKKKSRRFYGKFWQVAANAFRVNTRLAPVIFVLYLFLSFSTLFFIMILFNPTSSYLWLNKNFLSSQGTEVNKNSTSYTSVVSLQKKKKKKKKKEKKNKERVWGQTR